MTFKACCRIQEMSTREFLEDSISHKPWSSTTKSLSWKLFLHLFFIFQSTTASAANQDQKWVELITTLLARLNPQSLYQRSKTLICIFRPPTHGFLWSNCFQGCCLPCSTPKSPRFVQNIHAIGTNIRAFSQAFSRNPRAMDHTAENLFLPLSWFLLLLSHSKHSPLNTWKSCWCKKTDKTRGKQTIVTGLSFWLVQL